MMARSQLSLPRFVNFLTVLFLVGFLLIWSLTQNKAQEMPESAPNPTATQSEATPETPAISPVNAQAVDAPVVDAPVATEKAESTKKPESTNPESASNEVKPADNTPVFPVLSDGPVIDSVAEINTSAANDATQASGNGQVAKTEKEKKESAGPAIPFTRTGRFVLLVFAVIVFVCFVTANHATKFWRLPDHHFRIFVLLLAFFGSAAAVYLGWNRLTLGIDLQGGVVLVYDVKPLEQKKHEPIDMDQLSRAISKRINPGGVREIAIAPLGGTTSPQMQVIIPKAEDAEVARIQRVISESGALTFRILASPLFPADESLIEQANRETGTEIRDSSGALLARWVPVYEAESARFRSDTDVIKRDAADGQLEILVLFNDGVNVTGEFLTSVGRGMSEQGNPGVSFSFNSIGENKFTRLTAANKPNPAQPNRLIRRLGIILNDSLYSAPTIRTTIGAHGIIEFSKQATVEEQVRLNKDMDELISILDAGALPATLDKEPASRLLIGATLGVDTIQKGSMALALSTVTVLAFMTFYYRLAGLIACFCVVTNIMMLVAIMLSLRAAFTLPGLAGLVLTVGMAVDANILVFERLREELKGDSSLKMAIRNAYAKALSAIVDSNVTTIITGIILYSVGTEQVKGFAVTLVLGITLSMFTAIYCARTIMDILANQRNIKKFNMAQFFGQTKINFLGARNICFSVSIVFSIIGLIAVAARGPGMFDIDFVGGVNVEAVFKNSQEISHIRSKLFAGDKSISDPALKLNDLAVQNVQSNLNSLEATESGSNKENTHFIITTSMPQVKNREILPDEYLKTVRSILSKTFGDDLVYNKFDYTIEEKVDSAGGKTVVSVDVFPSMNKESIASLVDLAIQKAVENKVIENAFRPEIAPISTAATGSLFTKWTITSPESKTTFDKIFAPTKSEMNESPFFPTSTTVGGSVAKNTQIAGILAVLGSLVCIMCYIWLRFHHVVYGLAAVAGLVHDIFVVLGLIALSYWLATPLAFLQVEEFKIGLPVVAAFLTIIGYSLNDTIILFDRIRENKGKNPILTDVMINNAINQTLSRTILTSLTTLFVAVILYFFGGIGIHTFAFAMLVGIIIGTYSTIGISAPILYWAVGVPAKK
ncbi:MAG: protein translocase subunit SecD [Thermoguttaceae bacterium]